MASDPPARILVIDDDDAIRRLIVKYLEKNGLETYEAADGLEGIKIFRKTKPDLLLCDMRMPDTDGIEVLKVVKNESPLTPIIMISGAGLIDDVVEALRLGAWDFLIKPFSNISILKHAVNNSLHRAQLEWDNRLYRRQVEAANRELQASLAVLREDQEAGRHVQIQLLPEPESRFGTYTFSYILVPSLYLSGDFLDYFELGDGCLGFYIADVSGHGSSSAFVTVLLKSLITQAIRRYKNHGDTMVVQPVKVFEYLNSEVLHAGLGKYLTMFYGILDTKTHTLRYSNGGHYPPPIVKSGKSAEFIPGEGLPVGLFEFPGYTERSLDIPSPFLLTMFSDGVLEILDADNLKEKEKYLLNLCENPEVTIDSLEADLKLDRVKDSPDDIAVLLMRRS